MVEQPDPALLAAIAGKIPAARTAFTTALSVSTEQPSLGGQVQELLIESGASDGSPGGPFIGYGAIRNSKHSV